MENKISQISLSFVVSYFVATVLLACSTAYAGSGSWSVDASGNWGTAANWNPATAPGTAAGDVVSLTTNITAARTITIDTASRTNGTLIIGDPTSPYFNYTLDASGGAGLTFNNSGSSANLVQTNNASASDTISVPLTLADNLFVTNRATLTLSGIVSGSSKGITKTGSGTLVLSGANTYGGGTTVGGGGTLQLGATDTLPVTGTVILGGSNSVGNLNLGTFNQTIASLTALSTGSPTNNITIGIGQALVINGTNGLFDGTDTGGISTTPVKMSGGGALVVTNASASVTVGKSQALDAASSTGSLDLSGLSNVTLGSSVTPINEVCVGYGNKCYGTLTLSNTNNLITATTLHVGNSRVLNQSATGTLILGAGTNSLAVNTINIGLSKGSGTIQFASQAAGSPGTVTIGGKTRATTDFSIGDRILTTSGSTPVGTLDLRGHVANVTAGKVSLGKEDNGTTTITGNLYFDAGTFTATNLNMAAKTTNGVGSAVATLTVSGGVFSVTAGGSFTLASQTGLGSATGTLNVVGGTFRSYADVLTGASNCTSTVNLDGGTLDMTSHAIGLGSQTVTVFNAKSGTLMNLGEFNAGAPLVKSGSGTLTLAGTNTYTGATMITSGTLTLGATGQLCNGNYAAAITNSGAFVFASSANQTLSGSVSGSGSLTKSGNGTLTLSGATPYSGGTAVNAGKLVVVSGGALANSAVSLASGATLGLRVLANEGQWNCKSLTLNSGTTTAELRFYGATPSATTAPLLVSGDLINNGTLNVTVGGISIPIGTYPLIRYTGSLTAGTLGTVTLPTGAAGTLVNNTGNNTIDLSVTTASSPLVWNGGSGDWDINTTANWTGSRTYYLEGDLVRFDDTSSGTAPFTVNLPANVNPDSVTVDNPTKDYTLSGPGALGGEASLIKRSAGTLTLSGANTYSGGTTLDSNAGTLKATVSTTQNSIGTGPVTIGTGSTLLLDNSNTSGITASKANTFAGAGLLKLNFATNTTARSTALPGLSGFAGTIQLASVSSTGDKLDAGAVNAPGATVQVASGNTLLIGSATASFGAISVQGTGNSEGRGALRMGAGATALAGPVTLLGDTTIASDTAGATLTGPIAGTAGAGATNTLTQGTTASAAGLTLSGAITNSANGGKVALTQTKGTLILSGANTYGGVTTVNGGGTLQIGAAGALPANGVVVLGGTNGAGNLALGAFSQTLASLTAVSKDPAVTNLVTIAPGQALVISGTAGLFVGLETNSTTLVKMSGGGSLVVTNASAFVTVGKTQPSEATSNISSLDLSQLSSVTLGSSATPLNEVRVAYGQLSTGTLTLSNTNNLITAATLQIANSFQLNAGTGTLILGAGTNNLAVNTINIGLYKGIATMKFASQTAGSPGTVTIGGKTGGVTDLIIGSKGAMPSGAVPTGTLDLRGHYANVAAGTVMIGREDNSTVTPYSGGAAGYLLFDNGAFAATNLVMAFRSGLNTGVLAKATATLTVSGGVFTVTGGPITLATQTGAGSACATNNLLGGTFRSYADILTGPSNCTGVINLDGGTLDMTSHAIGLGSQTVTVFNARSGTLMNLGQFNNGAPLIKTGNGTLSFAGTNTYSGATIVSNGTLRLTSTNCLPPAADLYLATGATNQLDYTGSLPIHALYVDGVRKLGGLYGQNNLSPYLSGAGFLTMAAQGTLLQLK